MNSTDAPVQTPKASEPESESESAAQSPPASESPARRLRGFGVMSPRDRALDHPAPPPEAIQRAANIARTTGHRFDLMRYLRLRRKP